MKISFNWLRELCELPPGVTPAAVGETADAGRPRGGIDRATRARGARRQSSPRCAASGRTRAPRSCRSLRVRGGGRRRGGGRVRRAQRPGAGRHGRLGAAGRDACPAAGRSTGARSAASCRRACCAARPSSASARQADGILILSPRRRRVGRRSSRATLGLLDEVLEVNVTPNRPDALSHAGIAREVAALFETRWQLPRARRGRDRAAAAPGGASTSRSATRRPARATPRASSPACASGRARSRCACGSRPAACARSRTWSTSPTT